MRSRVLYSRLASDKKGPVAALSLLTKNMVLCVWQGYGGGERRQHTNRMDDAHSTS